MDNKIKAYDLLNIVETAVSKARSSIEHQYIENVKSYFNEDKTPKMLDIEVNSSIISIPEVCMANLRPINVKNVNITFDCCIDGTENDELILDLTNDSGKNKMNISITLDSENVHEGIMKINDRLIMEYI